MKIKTGYIDLDIILKDALDTPSFTVIGARCGVGKTAFMLNLSLGMAEENKDVCYISLDSNAERIALRCSEILSTWRETHVNEKSFNNFDIVDKYITFDELVTFIEEKNKRDKTKIFFIDYLQLFCQAREEVYQESSFVAVSLKNLSTKLGITIIASSQLTRGPESRIGHRPYLTDLRDSGALEESADCVILMFRRDYYDPNDKPGQCEIIVAKNRKGELGTLILTFQKENNAFFNYKPASYHSVEDDDAFKPFSKISK